MRDEPLRGRERWRAAGRQVLRSLCRLPFKGRYFLVDRLASTLMPAGLVPTTLASGTRIRCDLRDEIQRLIYYGLYDPIESALLSSLLREGDVFFDVGANVGYYTLVASSLVGQTGALHAFEPVPATFAVLERNVQDARLANARLNQVAVSDGSTEQLTLYVPPTDASTGWASISATRPDSNIAVSVAVTSLDRYVVDAHVGRVSLVKIDVEGAEPQVLRGSQALLSSRDAPDVVCEVNPFVLRRAHSSEQELIGLFRDFGYRLFDITASGLHPWTEGIDDRVRNVLATKNGSRWDR